VPLPAPRPSARLLPIGVGVRGVGCWFWGLGAGVWGVASGVEGLGVECGNSCLGLVGSRIAPAPQHRAISAGRANMAHTRQSRPEYGLGVKVNARNPFPSAPSLLGSGVWIRDQLRISYRNTCNL